MRGWLRELVDLLHELDRNEIPFRSARNTSSARQASSRQPGTNGTANKQSGKTGREKFETKRKVKRLKRLLRRAEREGYDVAELLRCPHDKPRVVSRERTDITKVVVDQSDAEIEVNGDVVTVHVGKYAENVTVPFTVGTVEKNEKLSTTIFTLRPKNQD